MSLVRRLQRWYYFSTKSHSLSRDFFHFAWDALRKTLGSSVGSPQGRFVLARRRPQNGILGVNPSGSQKNGSWRVLSRNCKDNELQFPPSWGLAFSCRKKAWFIFLFGRNLEFFFKFILLWIDFSTSLQEFYWQDFFTVPKDASHDFTSRSLHTEFFLAWRWLVMPFHLSYFLHWIIMMNPHFITEEYSWQKNISVLQNT